MIRQTPVVGGRDEDDQGRQPAGEHPEDRRNPPQRAQGPPEQISQNHQFGQRPWNILFC